MRKWLTGIVLLFCVAAALGQTTQITASHINYFAGVPINGTMCLSPVNLSGQPINLVTPGGQQLAANTPLCFGISSGVLAANAIVPDTSLTQPVNACYKAMIFDATGTQVGNTYPCLQPAGATWSFDAYVPGSLAGFPVLQLPLFYTNGTLNASQTRYNLIAGAGMAINYAAPGDITLTSTVSGGASNENLVYNATPTFSTAFSSSRIALSGNITTFTLAAGTDGQMKCLEFFHDGTSTAYTVAPPANVKGFFGVGSTASKRNNQCYVYYTSDSLWEATSPGVINE